MTQAPGQQPYPQQPYYGPPVPQVVTKPGGLSSAAHAVHILAVFFTCGVWLPFYILFIVFAPTRRSEVIVPYGADPAAVAAAYASIEMTPEEKATHNRKLLWVAGLVLLFVTTLVVLGVIGSLTK